MTEQHLAYSLLDLIQIIAPYAIVALVLGGMIIGYICHTISEEWKYRRYKRELKGVER